jgi:hypothetical protein
MRCLEHLGLAVLLGVVVCGCGDQPEQCLVAALLPTVPELLQVATALRAVHPARAVSVRPWAESLVEEAARPRAWVGRAQKRFATPLALCAHPFAHYLSRAAPSRITTIVFKAAPSRQTFSTKA